MQYSISIVCVHHSNRIWWFSIRCCRIRLCTVWRQQQQWKIVVKTTNKHKMRHLEIECQPHFGGFAVSWNSNANALLPRNCFGQHKMKCSAHNMCVSVSWFCISICNFGCRSADDFVPSTLLEMTSGLCRSILNRQNAMTEALCQDEMEKRIQISRWNSDVERGERGQFYLLNAQMSFPCGVRM